MEMDPIIESLEQILEERGVPKNIKDSCQKCIDTLEDEDKELSVRVNTCISLLDDVANDPNIPMHTRTFVWNIVSMLEAAEHSS